MFAFGMWEMGKEMWDYNRTIFKYDQDQRLKRDFAALDYRIKQFELYREDIRDLVELTVGRMDIYHMVGAMLLQFIVVLFAEGRVEIEVSGLLVPHWFLEVYYLSLGCAFIFLLMSIWLAMHASVAAQSFGTRMLTRFIRLPIPNADVLNKARSKLHQFERGGIRNVFRIPFIMKHHTWRGDDKEAGNADRVGHGKGAYASAKDKNGNPGVIPAVSVDPSMSSPFFDDPDNNLPGAESDPRNIIDGHIALYRKLQSRWQCFDAYSRTSMALGFNQVIHAITTFMVMHLVFEQYAPFSAFIAMLPLQFVSLVLLNLDIKEAQLWEFYAAIGGSFIAPWSILIAVILYREDVRPIIYQVFVIINFVCHAAWLYTARGFAQPEEVDGISLPFRFRSVLYLDVFADATTHRKSKGKPGEERAEAIAKLQTAMDNAIAGNTQPYVAMSQLKTGAEACMELVDSPEDDDEINYLILRAAFMFEEQKLRSEENNVRRCFKRWNSEAVQEHLSEYVKGHIRTLEAQFEQCMTELINSISQPTLPGAVGRKHISLLSTGSCGLLEIEYDTGYEQMNYFYNRHTGEVVWEVSEGVEDRKRESIEHLTAKVTAFRENVENFLELALEYGDADEGQSFRSGATTLHHPSQWDLMDKTLPAVARETSDVDKSVFGDDDRSKLLSSKKKVESAYQKVYKAVSLAPSSNRMDPSKPIISQFDENKHPTYHIDKHLKKDVSFMPLDGDDCKARKRSAARGDLSFVGQRTAFMDDSKSMESIGVPERLPWGCVRGVLNSFCAMWCLAAVLGVLDWVMPFQMWPWDGERGYPINGSHHDHVLALGGSSIIAFTYPTPHFEASALRCSRDTLECENRFGSSWEKTESDWEPTVAPVLKDGVLFLDERVFHLSGTPQKPFATSVNMAAAFDGRDRVVLYRLLDSAPQRMFGIKVEQAPLSLDINSGELVMIHTNSTLVRYDVHTGAYLSAALASGIVAACKESANSMLVAAADSIHRIWI